MLSTPGQPGQQRDARDRPGARCLPAEGRRAAVAAHGRVPLGGARAARAPQRRPRRTRRAGKGRGAHHGDAAGGNRSGAREPADHLPHAREPIRRPQALLQPQGRLPLLLSLLLLP